LFFRTVPSANTLVRRVNETAFAFVVQARPCPAFGRPVHLRGVPPSITARYFSSCPSDSISRWTPCPPKKSWSVASGPPWLVSGFRFRARLGFSIPSSFFGPRGITPAFGYNAPHSSVRGTSTLLNIALLSAHYEPRRHRLAFSRLPGGCRLYGRLAPSISRWGEDGFSSCSACPCHRAIPNHPAGVLRRISQSAPLHAAFAPNQGARPPELFFVEATFGFTDVMAR